MAPSFLQGFEVFQIEISKAYGKAEWHEDLKKVLKMAGEANQKVSCLQWHQPQLGENRLLCSKKILTRNGLLHTHTCTVNVNSAHSSLTRVARVHCT